ncbi:MAG: hypothetical protein AB7L84_02875 [Acidimicrobiia bacterium]
MIAHAVGGGALPVPGWFVGYAGAAAVVLVAAVLRASWPTPRLSGPLADPAPRPPAPVRAGPAGRALGLALLGGTLAAAVVGPDSSASNVAPLAVTVGWWAGLPLACLVLGDVFAALSPFDTLVAGFERLTGRRDRGATDGPAGPRWTATASLFAFAWFWLAYHRPGSARAVAVLLVAYTAAAVAGGLRWGRDWLREGEGFAVLSSSMAALGLRRRRARVPATAGIVAVTWLGSTVFDAVSGTRWWLDVLGAHLGWARTLPNTVGLAWVTALVAAAVLVASKVADRVPGAGLGPSVPLLARGVVPLAAGWFVAHDLTLVLFEGQNLLFLASDPVGRGWDLFGTVAGGSLDYGIVEATWVRWAEIAALVAGHLGCVVVVHDAALRATGRRRAARVSAAATGLAVASFMAATWLVLGAR